MTDRLTRCVIGMAAFGIVVISNPALANQSTIQIVGYVAPVCEVTFGANTVASMEGVRLDEVDIMTGEFEVECNVPMEGTVASLNGGLVNQAAREGGFGGGVDEVEYDLTIDFPGLQAFGPFASDDLVNIETFDSGTDVLFNSTGVFRLDLRKPPKLFAGDYIDEIRIEVRPRE